MAKSPLPPFTKGGKGGPFNKQAQEGPSSSIGGYWHRP